MDDEELLNAVEALIDELDYVRPTTVEFVESLRDSYDEHDHLTEPQRDRLEEIHEELEEKADDE